jgi:enoyl-CoA hydratase/3-hydroxyacyl-CoA dehydrogenase
VVATIDDIETVVVIRDGRMGRGIGAVAALAEYTVFLSHTDEAQLEQACERVKWGYRKAVGNGATTEAKRTAALDHMVFATGLQEALRLD